VCERDVVAGSRGVRPYQWVAYQEGAGQKGIIGFSPHELMLRGLLLEKPMHRAQID